MHIKTRLPSLQSEPKSTELQSTANVGSRTLDASADPTTLTLPKDSVTLSVENSPIAPPEYTYSYDWDLRIRVPNGKGVNQTYKHISRETTEVNRCSITNLSTGDYQFTVTIKLSGQSDSSDNDWKAEGKFNVVSGTASFVKYSRQYTLTIFSNKQQLYLSRQNSMLFQNLR